MVTRTVVKLSVTKAFQSSVFQSAVNRAVQKFLVESHVANVVATRTNDLPDLTELIARFVRNEVEKRSLQKVETDRHQKVLNKASLGQKTKAKDEFPP